MKISHTMVSRKQHFLLSLLLLVCLSIPAQNLTEVIFGKSNKSNYIGQYNYNGKRKNGFGIERYRNGSLYVGDFSEDAVSGRGMMIMNGKDIPNVSGAIVYIGNWRDGKKSGKGTCYDTHGNLVYEGKFSNDKPTGSIGTGANDISKHFTIQEIGENLYLGEIKGDTPDGFGLMLQDDGSIIYGTMRDGVRQGIGMTFYTPELWEVGQWTDGNYRPFNNSQIAEASLHEFKAASKEWKREMRGELFGAAKNFTQAALTTVSIVQGVQGKIPADSQSAANDTSTNSKGKKKTAVKSKKDNTCKLCYGTGICNYCDGSGFNYAGGTPYRCTACKQHIGKCKRCHGSGHQ